MKKPYFIIAVMCFGLRPGLIASQYSFNYEGEKIAPVVIRNVKSNLESIIDGELVTVKIGNYKPVRDIVLMYFEYSGHRIVGFEEGESALTFHVEKGSTNFSGKNLAVLINQAHKKGISQSLDAAWLATLSGMQVIIYVDGPAVGYLYTHSSDSELDAGFLHKANISQRMKGIESLSLDEKICQLHRIGVDIYADNETLTKHTSTHQNDLCKYVIVDPDISYLKIIEKSEYQFIYDQVFQIGKR